MVVGFLIEGIERLLGTSTLTLEVIGKVSWDELVLTKVGCDKARQSSVPDAFCTHGFVSVSLPYWECSQREPLLEVKQVGTSHFGLSASKTTS